jgi:hypothetical protein
MKKPQSVVTAVYAIWATVGLDVFMTAISSENPESASAMAGGAVISLAVYGLLCINISRGRNWARNVYAVLMAAEVAALLAFDSAGVSDLETVVSYLMVPFEGWILFRLFGSESDGWFKSIGVLQRK